MGDYSRLERDAAQIQMDQDQGRWLEAEIRRATLRLAGGPDRRARISDLRREVGEVGSNELDRAMRRMAADGRVTLFPLDDPTELRPEDVRDALDLNGIPQHVVYVPSKA